MRSIEDQICFFITNSLYANLHSLVCAQRPENRYKTPCFGDLRVSLVSLHDRAPRSRSTLPMTDTDDRLIARLASIGDSSTPNSG